MKMKIYLVLMFIGMTTANGLKAQAVHQMNSITDTYYAFPNLYSLVFRAAQSNTGDLDLDVGSVGPTGVRSEFMLTDKFGLGVDGWFSQSKLDFKRYDAEDSTTYSYHYSTSKFASLVTFNFHYGNSDKIDFYSSVGAGYSSRKFKTETNDPNFTGGNFKSPIPVAFRLSTGMRFMFTRFVGANIAIGLGGPLLSIGVTAKF